MSRPKTIDDEQLLAAAREVFRTKGHTASTREVARAVGLSEAVLYQRFGSKDELFFAAMGLRPPDVPAILGPEGGDARRALSGIVQRLVAYFTDLVPTMLQLLTHPSSSSAAFERVHQVLPAELIDGLAQRIAAMSRKGQLGPVNPPAVALLLVSTAHSLGHLAILPGGHLPTAPQLDALVGVLWSGLAPPAEPPPAAPRPARRKPR